jgi:hypothetical protein
MMMRCTPSARNFGCTAGVAWRRRSKNCTLGSFKPSAQELLQPVDSFTAWPVLLETIGLFFLEHLVVQNDVSHIGAEQGHLIHDRFDFSGTKCSRGLSVLRMRSSNISSI